MKLLTCTDCGWVHMGRSFEAVVAELVTFKEYFDTLSKKDQKTYYGGKCSSIVDYMYCFRCGSLFTNMRKAKKNDCPAGSTIQPILIEEKKRGKQRIRRIKR